MNSKCQDIISQAIATAKEASSQPTGGKWLEKLVVDAGPCIREWDISETHFWSDWPDREKHFPGSTKQDIGIDAVAVRKSDGCFIAIQCKARRLGADGTADLPIRKDEIDKFASASRNPFWAERWLISNGSAVLSAPTTQVLSVADKRRPIKVFDIVSDLAHEQVAAKQENCPHCRTSEAAVGAVQTLSCLQNEAVKQCVRILRDHVSVDSGGLPVGQARGKVILPCGTGKTRISLRIIEELTRDGEVSVVLCPSIALVAQIRREFLMETTRFIRALAVCSDTTAGYNPNKEGKLDFAENPTADGSNVSESIVKGHVTTDVHEIEEWISGAVGDRLNVIFGTYQSGHRISEALVNCGANLSVMVADEAHRTAGLRRIKKREQQLRDFTVCHDNEKFPATFRLYQTATPRIYNVPNDKVHDKPSEWIVRSMDDEHVFGVELFRKSFKEAVSNGWLSDYRIIALGVNDPDSFGEANRLASETKAKRKALTTTNYLRGLAFALTMGGATHSERSGAVNIRSCIAFMNTVDKSRHMASDLGSQRVKNWVQKWVHDNIGDRTASDYSLEHLDASSNVLKRESAKYRLAQATSEKPHGVINVGIFGEGTDAPSLSAVAFLEPRRSPIDVIQAVGRAMRVFPGKEMGYIICPILFPPDVDPEQWLSVSSPDEGWQELGQILLALRAHDSRIEDNLSDLIRINLPKAPEEESTFVGTAKLGNRIRYGIHSGPPGTAVGAIANVLRGEPRESQKIKPLTNNTDDNETGLGSSELKVNPSIIVTGRANADGTIELRTANSVRQKPKRDGTPGPVDVRKTKKRASEMINKSEHGFAIQEKKRPRRTRQDQVEHSAMQMLELSGLAENGSAIRMNLLSKSGLIDNRVDRDLNLLRSTVSEAAFHLRHDGLIGNLNEHFGLDKLVETNSGLQADGCTIASLLMMNAAMLHQRIAVGGWLSGISDLGSIKNSVDVVNQLRREWNRILSYDFRPVLEPAIRSIEAVEDTGKLAGLERSLRHIAAEAERIAATYADMGTDHAGPLFNQVMGNQASDGAFFTRPVAASLAARLTLDACGDLDWSDPKVLRNHKTVDLACGSGTLLAAIIADMKRRAAKLLLYIDGGGGVRPTNCNGSNRDLRLGELQKLAVEETIKGLDINPVSLQLAASQLISGNQQIRYRKMGLHLMPYGPSQYGPDKISAGTLELLGQRTIVQTPNEIDVSNDTIESQVIWDPHDDYELEDAVDAAKGARIVIINPPFTNRAKMGEKFAKKVQSALRRRVDWMEHNFTNRDPDMKGFGDKNSIGPLFVALADHCLNRNSGVLTMINPTIALTAPSGRIERNLLSRRYQIETILSCHQPGNVNLSQNTSINESIVVLRRRVGPAAPTRFINLDKMPVDDNEVERFHRCLNDCPSGGLLANGWGEVSMWPPERIEAGDWTPAVWRSPELAEAAADFANHSDLRRLGDFSGLSVHATGQVLRGSFESSSPNVTGSFPILKGKGGDAQKYIRSNPDEYWVPKDQSSKVGFLPDGTHPKTDKILKKAGYLLITAGQDTGTGRLTAVASAEKYVGNGWIPVTGLSVHQAAAISVFINSTAGRLQIMRNPGKKINFPYYSAEATKNIRVPDPTNHAMSRILAECWEQTKDMNVPQFREGDCKVREQWDEAVAEAPALGL